MVRPMSWILPAQGLLLLFCLALQSDSWNPNASAGEERNEVHEGKGRPLPSAPNSTPSLSEPFTNITPLLSSSSGLSAELVMPLTCQAFQCFGERCYQEAAVVVHGNSSWESCHNASHCELIRVNSTSYAAGCSSECGNGSAAVMCGANSRVSLEPCTMECCGAPNCLRLNATAYGDPSPITTTTVLTTATTTATTTTTTAAPQNGKVCGHFTCHGEGCYLSQRSSTSCHVGYDFCEMKKSGSTFVAGCSRVCPGTGTACAMGSKGPCYQECCSAKPRASCLRLDGKVHLNGAGVLGAAALPPLLALLSLTFAFPPFLLGNN
ncbi:uncharacterized protein LOC103280538 isoform X1 [Anolis carolinensis]|uniref:uncharacterized protein LOC103280538 isoform X1 n=1 Tax=Anolis carolinensis TaxID=28377 RepID=UPI002F2B36DD